MEWTNSHRELYKAEWVGSTVEPMSTCPSELASGRPSSYDCRNWNCVENESYKLSKIYDRKSTAIN